MTNIEVLKNKKSQLLKYLNFLKDYQGLSLETIKKDKTIRGAIERYLFLVCQSAIDYAEAVVGYS